MPQSLTKLAVHLIFSTKNREPAIANDTRAELERYLGGILRAHNCSPIRIAIQPEHAHVLFLLGRTMSISQTVKEVKTGSTAWLKKQHENYRNFHWQRGYGAFSVSESAISQVIDYIANQGEHHRKMTFQDEFRTFCAKHKVDIDERYVWE